MSDDFKRERGVYTKVQRAGAELAGTTDIEPQGGGVYMCSGHVVNFLRLTYTCNAFLKSRPRTRCAHWWAVAFHIDPPTQDECDIPAPEIVPEATAVALPTKSQSLPSEDDISVARDTVVGGYTRHKNTYDKYMRDTSIQKLFFVNPFFQEVGGLLEWRQQEKRGRKQLPLANILFFNYVRTEYNLSFRGAEGFMRFLAHGRIGFIGDDYPDFALANRFVCDPAATPVLRDAVALLAQPFADIGKLRLAGDGTGMGTNAFDDWRCEGKYKLVPARERGSGTKPMSYAT